MTDDNSSNASGLNPAEALSNCILSQYNLCAAGVLGGAAYGIKYKKGVVPMVVAGVTGSVADAIYGYVKACETEVEAYRKSSD